MSSQEHEETAAQAAGTPSEPASQKKEENDHDVEKAMSASKASSQQEELVIDWDTDDPDHPQNWTRTKMYTNFTLIVLLTLTSPMGSSILAPVVPTITSDFKSTSPVLETLVVSVYLLGYAAGPLLTAPLSEVYGRSPIYHASNIGFICFNVGCALSPTLNALIVFRFFAGVFGATPLTNGGGTVADMVPVEKRGKAMSIYLLGTLFGPVISPIIGGFLSDAKGWPWCFWFLAMLSGALEIFMLFFMDETYPPVLLRRRAKQMRKTEPNRHIRAVHENSASSPSAVFKRALIRPLKLLTKSPILIIVSLWTALVYGYTYMLFTSLSPVYEEEYGFPTDLIGLTYIGIGLGTLIGMGVFGGTADRYLKRKSAEADKAAKAAGRPEEGLRAEYRLFLFPFATLLVPIGMFVYGWPAQYHVQWVVPLIGTAILGAALNIVIMSATTYLIDIFNVYAASALAANTVIRSLAGGLLPMGALPLYDALGLGWGNSLLAFIALALMPSTLLVLKYGEFLRKKYEVKNL